MIIFERFGGWGLGNSLFQGATTVAIARDNNTTYAFPTDCSFRSQRFLRTSAFKNEFPWIEMKDYPNSKRWGVADILYVQPPKMPETYVIDGFFQSEKYFKHHRNEILELFTFSDSIQEIAKKYQDLYTDNYCALHVRRGDYAMAREMRIIDKSYYENATKLFPEGTRFVIFSDDIPWCKQNLTFLRDPIFIEERNDAAEMHMMSRFKNIIIANSTFSWWGAWMGSNNKVVMPNPTTNWFSNIFISEHSARSNNFVDLICENWIVL